MWGEGCGAEVCRGDDAPIVISGWGSNRAGKTWRCKVHGSQCGTANLRIAKEEHCGQPKGVMKSGKIPAESRNLWFPRGA